jgi:hypothetical protein
VAQVVNAETKDTGRRLSSLTANRTLPVRLAQRAALRRIEQPGTWFLTCAPPIHDGLQSGHQRHRPSPVALQRVHVQRAATLAGQDSAAQPQARTRNRYTVTDLQTGQLAPAQPGQREDGHYVTVRTRAFRCQRINFGQGERLSLAPGPAAGRLRNGRRHVVLNPPVRHGKREDGPQRGQGAGRRQGGAAARRRVRRSPRRALALARPRPALPRRPSRGGPSSSGVNRVRLWLLEPVCFALDCPVHTRRPGPN